MCACLRVGFVLAEMDFCLQHCGHVCNDGSVLLKYISVDNRGFVVQIWVCVCTSQKRAVWCASLQRLLLLSTKLN